MNPERLEKVYRLIIKLDEGEVLDFNVRWTGEVERLVDVLWEGINDGAGTELKLASGELLYLGARLKGRVLCIIVTEPKEEAP